MFYIATVHKVQNVVWSLGYLNIKQMFCQKSYFCSFWTFDRALFSCLSYIDSDGTTYWFPELSGLFIRHIILYICEEGNHPTTDVHITYIDHLHPIPFLVSFFIKLIQLEKYTDLECKKKLYSNFTILSKLNFLMLVESIIFFWAWKIIFYMIEK